MRQKMTDEQIDAARDETFMRMQRTLMALEILLKRDFDQVFVEQAMRRADERFSGTVVQLRPQRKVSAAMRGCRRTLPLESQPTTPQVMAGVTTKITASQGEQG